MPFHRFRAVVAVLVIAIGLVGLGARWAGAGEPPEEPITITPTSGPPGTVITASGENCDGIEALLSLEDGETTLDEATAELDEGGAWVGELVVPDDDSLIDHELAVDARCRKGTTRYAAAAFLVIVVPEPPAPTTTTTTTAPPTGQTPPAAPPAQPAAPVVVQPDVTG